MNTNSVSVRRRIYSSITLGFFLLVTSPAARAQWSTAANGTDVYKTNTSGNVGLGTQTPDIHAKLHVYNPPYAGVDIQSADTAGWSRLRLMTRTHTYGWFTGDSSQPDASNKIGLYDYTNNAFRMMIDSTGNVGIGTTNPGFGLQVETTSGGGGNGWTAFFREPGKNGVLIGSRGSGAATGAITGALSDLSNIADLSLNPFGGNVGIGTITPTAKLDVAGDIKATGTINAKYQDVAEWVPSSEKLAAGTVVVLDSTKSNQVVASTTAYDTRVAGVISAQPGITLGEKTDDKVLVATTGRVRVMVDATTAPINIGDLLVTSDLPGVAMKSEPIVIQGRKIHAPGTIIGKALEPLAKGKGEILVLLSLQ